MNYDAHTCLLSDRGFSQPVPDGPHMEFSFNLCSNAFINYLFVDVGAMFQNRFPPRVIESYYNRPEVAVTVVPMRNNQIIYPCCRGTTGVWLSSVML
jgi:hypothetical protein